MLIAAAAVAFLVIQPAVESQPAEPATPPVAGTGMAAVRQFIVLPDDGIQPLLDLIDAAGSRVYMKMYLLTDTRIVDALSRAQGRAADVRVMIEENPFGAGNSAQQALDLLKQAGLRTKSANPAFRLTHEKSFVIDDTAVILTANMTKAAFSRNREFGVVIAEPADVEEVAAAFIADWERSAFTPGRPDLVWSPDNSREQIDRVIEAAVNSLDVYAEVVLDARHVHKLAQAARRGVRVRLLISPPSQGETNSSSPGLDELQAGGVGVRTVRSPYIHAKAFVADGALAYTGSVNISTASMDFNRELGVLLADRGSIQRMTDAFERDWNRGVER